MELSLVLVLAMLPLATPQASEVILSSGPISGMQKSLPANVASLSQLQGRDTTYREYLGIPYADPPVGNLRFKPPQPLSSTWTETRDATAQKPSCMQPETSGTSEDCLYLNIWAPGDGSSSGAKPVMVWIHGGGFAHGSNSKEMFDGTMLTVIGDVIVVSMNYRLGIFGFLSTGDDVVPGNMGLLDQQRAIRWVKDNIAVFGGDPEKITIFGQSAGGSSVTQQVLSPTNSGLFKRVISQSARLFVDCGLQKDMTTLLKNTGTTVGCNNANNADLVECLRGKSAAALLAASQPPASFTSSGWGPVVDKEFILEHPRELMEKESGPSHDMLKNTELMIGINSDEGFTLLAATYLPGLSQGGPISFESSTFDVTKLQELLQSVGSNYGESAVAEAVSEMLLYTYFGPSGSNELSKEKLLEIAHDFVTDAWFLVPAVSLAELHIKLGGTSYAYHMTHRGPNITAPAWVEGAGHGADIAYIFPTVERFPDVQETERALMYNMITYWTNFAKTGNPNQPAASPALPVQWPAYTDDNTQYLELGDPIAPSQQGAIIKSDRVHFWIDYVPKIKENAQCTEDKEDDDDTNNCDGKTSNVAFYKGSPLMMVVMLLFLYA